VQFETIVGVATGSPDGGVAVVRLSGAEARAIARTLCGELGAARQLCRRQLRLGGGEVEDALVVSMPGPNSFTGEDVVELHVHAGELNVRQVVEACLSAGAGAAGAGEFSRRAFAHGRLSLDQAEGIAAVIGAKTEAALSQARRLVAGELGDQAREVISGLHRLRAEIEANLDFPEDVAEPDFSRWSREVADFVAALEAWLMNFERARRAREISKVVLAGRPNAGKSSLFNALLGRERALVADLPGTTRDYVESRLELGRHAVELVDTAGMRAHGADAIESAGIGLAKVQVEGADLVLHLVKCDARGPRVEPEDAEIVEAARDAGSPRWELWTQSDRVAAEARGQLELRAANSGALLCSVREDEGCRSLREALERWTGGEAPAAWVGLARHRSRAAEGLEFLREAAQQLSASEELELVAFALRGAEARLGEIDGRSPLGPVGAEVMDTIFSSFCIGK
jgi:tRNA modification GTPase